MQIKKTKQKTTTDLTCYLTWHGMSSCKWKSATLEEFKYLYLLVSVCLPFRVSPWYTVYWSLKINFLSHLKVFVLQNSRWSIWINSDVFFQLCVRSLATFDCIGPLKMGMKSRRDMIALAAEMLAKMFDRGEEELVQQVTDLSHCLGGHSSRWLIYHIV